MAAWGTLHVLLCVVARPLLLQGHRSFMPPLLRFAQALFLL
jgi:hypothetical protein